jgi:hypothetical protein
MITVMIISFQIKQNHFTNTGAIFYSLILDEFSFISKKISNVK